MLTVEPSASDIGSTAVYFHFARKFLASISNGMKVASIIKLQYCTFWCQAFQFLDLNRKGSCSNSYLDFFELASLTLFLSKFYWNFCSNFVHLLLGI